MSKVKLELLITNDLNEEFSGLFYFNSKFLFSDIKDFEENNYYGIKLDKNGIDFLEESQKCCHEDIKEVLFRIRKSFKKNCYEIISPATKCNQLEKNDDYIKNLDNRFWYVIKSNNCKNFQNNEDYILKENDIIKLGLTKYEVIKIKINKSKENFTNSNRNYYNYNINEINKKAGPIFRIDIKREQFKMPNEFLRNQYLKSIEYSNEDEEETNEDEQCWICLDSSFTNRDNPKLNLCKCRKKFVHYLCLKEYLKTKIIIHENFKHTVFTYICKKFNCDVCLSPYPIRFKIKELNRIYYLIDLCLPEEFGYMILESLDYIKNRDNIKKVHVIRLSDKEIYIGRNAKNDIVEDNLTVSRKHAVLKYNKDQGEVILENKSNTYGTLVLVKGNIKMIDKEINLQIGNSVISARLKNE
jgi:hypothetical protein